MVVANDVNCARVGEAWLGAGKPFKNIIMLALGTGGGGSIILGSELLAGHDGAASELGLVSEFILALANSLKFLKLSKRPLATKQA